MGASLADEGKFERAIAEFREALRIRPHDFEATCDLGVALDRRGETDAAIAYLREAGRLRPKDARVHLSLGAALVHQGHVDEAIALYREAIQLQPNFPNLHFNLGVALLHQRKVDEAISELTRAVELRPWYTEAYAILGGAFVLQGRLDEAVVQYRKALRLDPDHSASRINLGMALARQGRYAEAITQLREAIRRDRQNPEAHHVLGAILVDLGRIERRPPNSRRSSASAPITPELACSWRGSEVTACEFGRSLRRTGRNGLGRWMGCVAARGSPLTRPSGPLSPLTRGEGEGRPRHETGMDARRGSEDPEAFVSGGGLHAGADRVADLVLIMGLRPGPAEYDGLDGFRYHDHAILVGHDKVPRREEDPVDLDRHVDVDHPLAILAIVRAGVAGEDGERHSPHLADVSNGSHRRPRRCTRNCARRLRAARPRYPSVSSRWPPRPALRRVGSR